MSVFFRAGVFDRLIYGARIIIVEFNEWRKFDTKGKKGLDKYLRRYNDKAVEIHGILAQLGEHLPYKQRVTGSSPVGPIYKVF